MKLPQKVNILLLGGGGREHAFAWKIVQSPRLAQLYIATGNAGTSKLGINVDYIPTNFGALKQLAITNNINLVVVGPEEPLVNGIQEFFANDDQLKYIPIVGPTMAGAMLEGSKQYAKDFMTRHNIPTARYATFTEKTVENGVEFLRSLKPPYVLKADGLAAGKGVLIPETFEEAESELRQMLNGKFGAASKKVVIEEFLKGIELSVFVATDSKGYKILPEAKDYKRIGEGDTGLNTGGMGAISPVPFADSEFMRKVEERIIRPTVNGFSKDKIEYRGFVFIGLMNVEGEPYVIEYNVRMGDPETEVVIPRIESDIIDLFEGIVYGNIEHKELVISDKCAATVVAVSGGYPGDYTKGKKIEGLDSRTKSLIFHSGTKLSGKNIVSDGGRVLAVTSLGATMDEALEQSYDTLDRVSFEGMYYRKDIGKDLKRLTEILKK